MRKIIYLIRYLHNSYSYFHDLQMILGHSKKNFKTFQNENFCLLCFLLSILSIIFYHCLSLSKLTTFYQPFSSKRFKSSSMELMTK